MPWTDDPRSDAEVLRAFAAARGVSDTRQHRAFLAATLHTPPSTVARWLDGSRTPPAMARHLLDTIDRAEAAESAAAGLARMLAAPHSAADARS